MTYELQFYFVEKGTRTLNPRLAKSARQRRVTRPSLVRLPSPLSEVPSVHTDGRVSVTNSGDRPSTVDSWPGC